LTLTSQDLDLLNRALKAANKLAENGRGASEVSVRRSEADIRAVLARLASKGYDGDPVYQAKVREIEVVLGARSRS
jgi:hypothetical protein